MRNGQKTYRIVTHERGSWRWQDAYSIAKYVARRDRHGKLRWYSMNYGRRLKYSMPQIYRMLETLEAPSPFHTAAKHDVGSIHRRLVNPSRKAATR
jgi:hypothetical protein